MPARPLAVLVVDECPDTVSTCRDLLRLHGYDARTAASAEEALALLDGWAPDVAILDLWLPRADGFELAGRLRAPGASRPVLVAVTGMSTDEHLERALAAGFSYFLVKPADPQDLMRLLRTCADELGYRGRQGSSAADPSGGSS
jgi:CheY-like chemotaxis protein